MPRKHKFAAYANPDLHQGCVRCGRPPTDAIHHLIDKDELVHGREPDWVAEAVVPRVSHTDMFLEIAEIVRRRSTCSRGSVGSVIVRDRRIIACGYNGAPPGQPHCTEVGCDVLTVKPVDTDHDEYIELGCQRAIHAEANALAWAARAGVSTYDTVMYNTHSPCLKCAQLMVSAGITAVYFREEYRLPEGVQLLEACNVIVHKV